MSLNELLKKLEVFSADERHEEVFEAALDILQNSPHDARALRLTIVSLINMDKYNKAYSIIKKYPGIEKDPLTLEKLYVLYKLGKDAELGDAFTKLGENKLDKGLLYLKAQYLYRIGQYPESLKIFHSLIESSDNDEEELLDLSINERAIISDAEGLNLKLKTASNEVSFDLVFNDALIALSQKNYNHALSLLEVAETLVNDIEDPEERFVEQLPILLQRAYIYHITGQVEEAQSILESIDSSQAASSSELNSLIYKNNYTAVLTQRQLTPQESFITMKDLNLPNAINVLESRLSQMQRNKLLNNYSRLALLTGQNIKAKTLTSQALQVLDKADVALDQGDLKSQARKATKFALKNKGVASALIACQLNADVGNLDSSVTILENLDLSDLLTPGVASLLLSLYESLNSEKKKINLWNKIYESVSGISQFSTDQYDFLKIIAFKFFELANDEARELLTRLNAFRADDLVSIVLGKRGTDELKPVEELTSGLDLEELIQEGVDAISKQTVKVSTLYKVAKKRHQKRKNLPKAYDENKEADPERWLPMKDRSYYKPKKSKKKNLKGTQGGSADNYTEEDLSSKPRVSASSSASGSKKTKKKGKK